MSNKLGFRDIQDKLHKGHKFPIKSVNADKVHRLTKGEGVKIMVIDTGIDKTHKDLSHSFVEGMDMFNMSSNVYDDYAHGTAVAGLITGKRTGISPNAELYSAKSLDGEGKGDIIHVLEGITYATNKNVDVVCMSLGIKNGLPLILKERIRKAYDKGITFVCASGNDGSKLVDYPAKLDYVIGAGSVDNQFNQSEFSNFDDGLDFVSPAENVATTYLDNQYAKATGTSFSSPIITGCVALIISYARKKDIELTPKEIKDILIASSSNNGFCKRLTGWGVPNVEKAFEEIDKKYN